ERWCYRVAGTQQPVHDPRLAPNLGGEPAREDGDEAGRESEEGPPEKPARRLEPAAQPQEVTEPRNREHDQPHPHHDPKTEERNHDRWPVLLRERFQSDLARGPIAGGNKAAKLRDLDCEQIPFARLVR